MSIKAESPKRIAGPPVGFVPVEYNGRVVRDAVVLAESSEFFWSDVVTDELVLEIGTPIDVDGPLNVAHVVEKNVFVALDQAQAWVGEVFGDPLG